MTLRRWRQVVTEPSKLLSIAPAVDPWLNSVGIYHRKRKGFGLQYCPQCLAEGAFYKKEWRLSFVTACLDHNCSLSDCCGRCQAPICFHRNDALMLNCWCCGFPLGKPASAYDSGLEERIAGQRMLMRLLNEQSANVGFSPIGSPPYFAGISLLLRTIKTKLAHVDKASLVYPPIVHCAGERIELQRLGSRAEQCRVVFRLLNGWPESLVELGAELRLTQCSFDRKDPLSDWLKPAVTLLPAGARRIRVMKTAPIRLALSRVHRKKAEGWRANRARILMVAAGTRT